jgi:hypothetical protein
VTTCDDSSGRHFENLILIDMKKLSLLRFLVPVLGGVAALALLNGCGDSKHGDHGHGHSHGDDHAPPHGGTPVVIAEDKFHLELVRDAGAGKMQAYVLDGHLEKYVAVPETSFLLVAKADGRTEQLNFQRAPEPPSGSVPPVSSLFEGQGEWLKSVAKFDGSIPTITLKGKSYTNISFSFPKGTKHVH